jgi:hypothetical protein
MNDADIWDDYYIERYRVYVPELVFVPVFLKTAPIVRDTPQQPPIPRA